METFPVVTGIQVRYQDLDPYGHVNNAVHLAYFEAARLAYLARLIEPLGLGPMRAGDIPGGVRYVIAEATVRYEAAIRLEEPLLGGASIRTVGKRSFVMDYELRIGEDFGAGSTAAGCTSAQVFYDIQSEEVRPRPEWFLPAVAALEGRPEESFAPPPREES